MCVPLIDKKVSSVLILVLLLAMGFQSCRVDNKQVLFEDDFDYPDGELPALYWAEGTERVKIVDKRLQIDATPDVNNPGDVQSTIWLNKEFSGDVHIEFDAHVIAAPKHENNINFFLFYSDPEGRALEETRQERTSAQYKLYHGLKGYIFTYVANGDPDQGRFRLRDNPGFNLLDEYNGFECRASKTYHIEIIKKDNRLQYLVDGNVFLDVVDDKFENAHNEGLIGFRTWRTALWFDNLKVSRI